MSKLHLNVRPLTVAEVASIKNRTFDALRFRAENCNDDPPIQTEATHDEVLRLCAMVLDQTAPLPHPEVEVPHEDLCGPIDPDAGSFFDKEHWSSEERDKILSAAAVGESPPRSPNRVEPEPPASGPMRGSAGGDVSLAEVLYVLKYEQHTQAWRECWFGKHQRIMLQRPGPQSKMTEPYLYLLTAPPMGVVRRVPWQPTQDDVLADDWNWEVRP